MKRYFFLILIFAIVSSNAFSQIIKGTVLDKNSRAPVDFAAVFFNGTFVGTNTDKNGCFELDISQNSSMPLTISALGYNSVTLTEYYINKPISIFLETKVFGLKEVIVSGKASSWTRRINLEIFLREFLGSTLNSWNSEIVNKDDIIFYQNPGTDTLNAYSLKPIIIQNKSLGYIIYYYLDKFAYCNSNGY
ncbi:MAG: carboxypeptidase-like regulatory domain-containing protein, partial [Bacteroidales bacterium]|nr:carboxypeptidase-like regulatory domain-containing protein [Bacteroidales bacterium]